MSAFARYKAKSTRRVQVVDAVERKQLQAGPARVLIKLQRPRAEDRVIGDELRRFEVALQAGFLHGLNVSEIGEALAADRIRRGIDTRIEVESREIGRASCRERV